MPAPCITYAVPSVPRQRVASTGQAAPAAPTPAVESTAIATQLTSSWRALDQHGLGATRDTRFAPVHRAALWASAQALAAARPRGADLARLREPLMALREFLDEFGGCKDSGDERLQTRMMVGASAARPGLLALLERVLGAAGMLPPVGVDHARGGN